jgi:hypothetical protein
MYLCMYVGMHALHACICVYRIYYASIDMHLYLHTYLPTYLPTYIHKYIHYIHALRQYLGWSMMDLMRLAALALGQQLVVA